jgi:hypothetical protein
MGIWHPAGMWELHPGHVRWTLTLHWNPVWGRPGQRPRLIRHQYKTSVGPEFGPVLMLRRTDGLNGCTGWLVYRHALF